MCKRKITCVFLFFVLFFVTRADNLFCTVFCILPFYVSYNTRTSIVPDAEVVSEPPSESVLEFYHRRATSKGLGVFRDSSINNMNLTFAHVTTAGSSEFVFPQQHLNSVMV